MNAEKADSSFFLILVALLVSSQYFGDEETPSRRFPREVA
jgi:hypothetical protein